MGENSVYGGGRQCVGGAAGVCGKEAWGIGRVGDEPLFAGIPDRFDLAVKIEFNPPFKNCSEKANGSFPTDRFKMPKRAALRLTGSNSVSSQYRSRGNSTTVSSSTLSSSEASRQYVLCANLI
jgi:hypothetical protein